MWMLFCRCGCECGYRCGCGSCKCESGCSFKCGCYFEDVDADVDVLSVVMDDADVAMQI